MSDKLQHGKYVLCNSKGIFIFDTRLKRGRVLRPDGSASDFSYKTHPKFSKSTILRGKWGPGETKKGIEEYENCKREKSGKDKRRRND